MSIIGFRYLAIRLRTGSEREICRRRALNPIWGECGADLRIENDGLITSMHPIYEKLEEWNMQIVLCGD
jgi:hypothetical protein